MQVFLYITGHLGIPEQKSGYQKATGEYLFKTTFANIITLKPITGI